MLVPNPRAEIALVRDDESGAIVGIEVDARARGRPRSVQRVLMEEDPGLFDALFRLAILRKRPELGAELPEDRREELEALRLLVREEEVAGEAIYEEPPEAPPPAPNSPSETAVAAFRERGVALVERLLPAGREAVLRRYLGELFAEGYPFFEDAQSARYWMYNEPVARRAHEELAPLVERFAGEPVQPSYCYTAWYRDGAELPRHRDRDASVFAVSYLVDYRPEPEGPAPWPLRFHLEGRPEPLELELPVGGAVVYRGCEIEHERPPIPAGHAQSSLFFLYVPRDYAGSLD